MGGRVVTDWTPKDQRIDVLERAILATRDALTEQARRDVHIYLTCELDEPEAAEAWHQLTLAPHDEGRHIDSEKGME